MISVGIGKDLGTSFSGADLIRTIGGEERTALTIAESLLRHNLISLSSLTRPPLDVSFSLESRYFLVSLAPLPTREQGLPLNRHYWWHGPSRPATALLTHLRGLILDLYEKHLSPDGKSVSYKAMSRDPLFRTFVDATAELQALDLSTLQG